MSIGVGDTNTQGTSSGGIQTTPSFFNSPMAQQILQQYMQGQQGQQGLNNFLVGGKGFNPNNMAGGKYTAPPTSAYAPPGGYPPTVGGGGTQGGGQGPKVPDGSGGDPNMPAPEGSGPLYSTAKNTTDGGLDGGGDPPPGQFGQGQTVGGGDDTPSGGLIGSYQDTQNNPWQTGPNGDSETDALGSYDWMSSGDRTNSENSVYDRTGDMARSPFGVDASGRSNGTVDPNDPSQTLEGEGNAFNQDLMTGRQSDLEQGATGGYQDFANGPNAQERSLYGDTTDAGNATGNQNALYDKTGAFGSTPGKDLQGAESVYGKMTGPDAGYDDATKAAITRESMAGTRSPFEQARDRTLRSAAARGNVGSTQGAEIQMANNEATALGDTGAKNQIAIAQEAQRQREAGAQGLQGTQGISNAQQEAAINSQAGQNTSLATQRQAALNSRAGQNAQLAGQKLAGTQGLAGMGAAQRANQAAGAAQNVNLSNQNAANKFQSLGMQNTQNQQQRTTQATGVAGKAGMFNEMAGRKATATAGLQGLYNTGQGVQAGQQAGAAGLGMAKTGDQTVFGNQNNTGTGNWSV